MKRFLIAALAVSSLTAIAAPSMAAPWQSVRAREAMLQQRIDTGVRNGALTRQEAMGLQGQLHQLEAVEDRYRATGGLQAWEMQDLDRRLDALARQIRTEKNDGQVAGWAPIRTREAALVARIDQGVRSGRINQGESIRLRAEFRGIVDLEHRYWLSGGLQPFERQDLDRRFNALNARITIALNNQGPVNGWTPMAAREAALIARIDQGVRSGRITQPEAQRIRAEFRALVDAEARARQSGGLSPAEQADLNRRFQVLNARVTIALNNNQTR